MDHNRMSGNEFGSAKWGEVRDFNEKYAAKDTGKTSELSVENKVLSQNVRFRYDSDTLRNNNVFVVGGSGAGKTAFFLTPNSPNIKNSSAPPFWEKAEKMFLESLFLYVWMECPKAYFNTEKGKVELLQQNWKSILFLLDEAQFLDNDTPPKLDERMNELARKKTDYPAVKAYQRYRGGPDDDDTFNFVPGMVYTMLFQELYRQARFFGGKLPMDVGFWLDEMANIKMPNNFDKILATCRSRGVYCVPILQSLAQLKILFADGAWEGIVGNCDTFIYLGGNEASTYEYVSKLLGKWTIDKRTSGESKGSSGSYSENYDVLGRELMLEYEIRLLPDDECIIFVRGENPIRDKKWFPWEHEEYLEARKCGAFVPAEQKRMQEKQMEECQFVGDASLAYLKKQKDKIDCFTV